VLGVKLRNGRRKAWLAPSARGTEQTQRPGLCRERGSSISGSLRQENQYAGGSAKTGYL